MVRKYWKRFVRWMQTHEPLSKIDYLEIIFYVFCHESVEQ